MYVYERYINAVGCLNKILYKLFSDSSPTVTGSKNGVDGKQSENLEVKFTVFIS
jgi:hypothetical protein